MQVSGFKFARTAILFTMMVLSAQVFAATIKIGAIFAVTGAAAYLGAPEEKTARLFVDNLNKDGGINGTKVELIIKDSAGSAEKRFRSPSS